MNLTQSLSGIIHAKVYEPKKRLFQGSFGWAYHKYPIKGGISFREIMARSLCEKSPLLKMIVDNGNTSK